MIKKTLLIISVFTFLLLLIFGLYEDPISENINETTKYAVIPPVKLPPVPRR